MLSRFYIIFMMILRFNMKTSGNKFYAKKGRMIDKNIITESTTKKYTHSKSITL